MKVKSESEVAQLCLTLRNPMDCSLPGSSIHGIFQARVLEWGALILGGSKIIADGDCSHEIKRCLLLGREKAMAPHSSTLAWKIPWMEEPGRLQSMGSLRVGHD